MRRNLIVALAFAIGVAVAVVGYGFYLDHIEDEDSEEVGSREDDGTALGFMDTAGSDKRAYKPRRPSLKPDDLNMTRTEFTEARVKGGALGQTEGSNPVDLEGFRYVGMVLEGVDWTKAFEKMPEALFQEVRKQKILVSSKPMLRLRADTRTLKKLRLFPNEAAFDLVFFPVAYEPQVKPPLVTGEIQGGKVFVQRGISQSEDLPDDFVEQFAREAEAAGWQSRPPAYLRITDRKWREVPGDRLSVDLIIPVGQDVP